MTYDLVRTIDATSEPVTVNEAKDHARVDIDDDDAWFATAITAARQYSEKITGRAFIQQTWRLSLPAFPSYWTQNAGIAAPQPSWCGGFDVSAWRTPEILLPRPKLIGIGSVTYLDVTGVRQTLNPSQYTVDFDSEPARVMPAIGSYWPATLPRPGSVQVTFVAGYGNTSAAVPATLQMAILELVAHWYENREATVLPTSGTGVVSVPLGFAELIEAETFTAFTLES